MYGDGWTNKFMSRNSSFIKVNASIVKEACSRTIKDIEEEREKEWNCLIDRTYKRYKSSWVWKLIHRNKDRNYIISILQNDRGEWGLYSSYDKCFVKWEEKYDTCKKILSICDLPTDALICLSIDDAKTINLK